MGIEQIGTQFYVVRYSEGDRSKGFTILDGPYPDRSQALSMSRIREVD